MLSLTACVLATAIAAGQPNQGPPKSENLAPLKPLIGKWVGEFELHEDVPGVGKKGEPTDFTLSYRWSKNGQAVLMELAFVIDGKPLSFTNGMIIWDPVASKIVGTDTYADGGMTRYEVEREGRAFVLMASGAKSDGTRTSEKYTFANVAPNRRTIDITDQKKGGQSLPDVRGIEIRRTGRRAKVKAAN